MESEHFFLMFVEDMSREASVCIEKLPLHHTAHAQISLCHVADMIAVRIHDYVFIRLFKA